MRARPLEIARVVWQHGDFWVRTSLAVFIVLVSIALVGAAWVLLWTLSNKLPIEAALAYSVALTSAVFFQGAWTEPMFTSAVVEEYLRRGWWRSDAVPYYRERVRYLTSWGQKGRFPGTLWWGVLGWLVYLTLVLVAIPFITIFPAVGGQAGFFLSFGVSVSVSLVFFLLSGLRNRRLHLEADARGYTLVSLYPRRRHPHGMR